MSSKLTNPFPVPSLTSEKHRMAVQWINQRINSEQGLKFFDCLEKIQESLKAKDLEQATINCHYTSNLILKSPHFKNDHDRAEIINGFVESLRVLKEELEKSKEKEN